MACFAPGVSRYKKKKESEEEARLRRYDPCAVTCRYQRYGYKRITALLQVDSCRVNHNRVMRIRREEGLQIR